MAEGKFDVEREFERLTDLIQDNTYPGDFSCSGWSTLLKLYASEYHV